MGIVTAEVAVKEATGEGIPAADAVNDLDVISAVFVNPVVFQDYRRPVVPPYGDIFPQGDGHHLETESSRQLMGHLRPVLAFNPENTGGIFLRGNQQVNVFHEGAEAGPGLLLGP